MRPRRLRLAGDDLMAALRANRREQMTLTRSLDRARNEDTAATLRGQIADLRVEAEALLST